MVVLAGEEHLERTRHVQQGSSKIGTCTYKCVHVCTRMCTYAFECVHACGGVVGL